MTPSESFEIASKTLVWGKEALTEFQAIADEHFTEDTYLRVVDDDFEKRVKVVKLVPIVQFPFSMAARKATEAVQSIKNTFDQATHAASFSVDTKLFGQTIYFPWVETPTGLQPRLSGSKIPPKLWPAFERFEPYGRGNSHTGGDSILRKIAQIANRKHDIGLSVTPHFFLTGTPVGRINGPAEFHRSRWNPVNGEVELFRYGMGSQIYYNYTIEFNITFDKTTTLNNVPVFESVSNFAAKAEKVIAELRAATGC